MLDKCPLTVQGYLVIHSTSGGEGNPDVEVMAEEKVEEVKYWIVLQDPGIGCDGREAGA